MLFTNTLLPALLVAFGAQSCAAKAISYRPNQSGSRTSEWNEMLKRTAIDVADSLFPREALPQPSDSPSSSITTSINSNSGNANTTAACLSALSGMQNATNPAGIVACYDIPYLNTTNGEFTAELRLYQLSQPSGAFAGVLVKNILTSLQYPAAKIASMSKRLRRTDLVARQVSAATLLDTLTFAGQLDQNLRLDKLNSTELMSLVIPTIALEAVSPSTNQPVNTNLTFSDVAYFPAGVFSTQSASSEQTATNPAVASAAIIKAEGFILPGVTLGIFPTGLIVTGAWTVMFLAAFGFGTLSRVWHRKQYRNRILNRSTMKR